MRAADRFSALRHSPTGTIRHDRTMSIHTSPLTGQVLNPASGGDGPSAKKQRTQTADGLESGLHDNQYPHELADGHAEHHATAEAHDGSEGEAGPQLTEDFDSTTDTVKAGIYMMQSRTQAVNEKVRMLCLHTSFPSLAFESVKEGLAFAVSPASVLHNIL